VGEETWTTPGDQTKKAKKGEKLPTARGKNGEETDNITQAKKRERVDCEKNREECEKSPQRERISGEEFTRRKSI